MGILGTIKDDIKDITSSVTGKVFKKSYVPRNASTKPIVCGFPDGEFPEVDSKYRIKITSSKYEVHSIMQDNFKFDVTSEWGPLVNFDIPFLRELGGFEDSAFKAATGIVLKNMALTRRKWMGSSPLRINMRLEFRAVNDAENEVVTAVRGLQSMVLPEEMSPQSMGNDPKASNAIIPFFLQPPGPNEFWGGSRTAPVAGEGLASSRLFGIGDPVSLEMFGGTFKLDLIIVKSVSAVFDKRMTANGPMQATVELNLESYEMMTKNKLEEAYQGLGYTTKQTTGITR